MNKIIKHIVIALSFYCSGMQLLMATSEAPSMSTEETTHRMVLESLVTDSDYNNFARYFLSNNLHESPSIFKGFLQYIAKNPNHENPYPSCRIAELVAAAGASLNDKDESGDTALHYAVNNNFDHLARHLVLLGADYDITNNNGETPLYYLDDTDLADECIKNLMEQGKNLRNNFLQKGKEALEQEDFPFRDMYRLLNNIMGETIIINAQDEEGNTLLHLATMSNHKEMACFLITHGASIYIKNNTGQTASDLAVDRPDIQFFMDKNKELFNAVDENKPEKLTSCITDGFTFANARNPLHLDLLSYAMIKNGNCHEAVRTLLRDPYLLGKDTFAEKSSVLK